MWLARSCRRSSTRCWPAGRHGAEIEVAPRDPLPAAHFEPSTSLRDDARAKGYTGDTCDNCGSTRMLRTGHCNTWEACGTTTGCS